MTGQGPEIRDDDLLGVKGVHSHGQSPVVDVTVRHASAIKTPPRRDESTGERWEEVRVSAWTHLQEGTQTPGCAGSNPAASPIHQ